VLNGFLERQVDRGGRQKGMNAMMAVEGPRGKNTLKVNGGVKSKKND